MRKINKLCVIDRNETWGPENISIYKVLRTGTGDEVFTAFKPSKKDLLEISKKEGWYNEDEFPEAFTHKDIVVFKIKLYSK